MSYRIRINEHVQHRRLPDYCLEILAEVKGAWVGVPTNLPKCAIGTIDSTIERMRFMGLNSQAISGSDVPRKESKDGKALTIYSRTGNTALVTIEFIEFDEGK